ncbi:hypothetical protein [Intestinirhabdus alba]|jgi:hypothetical protein|uniref:Lipoprotein n=1 Tax=Intestinirhabdus alba TaxID=2899544 RepID=A0A6L6ILQ9_9ENTR|nr:hypothetical protein [Intestinirhabdus alba]MTH45970.1 hypothetical protein [Intestinirhabdus alba]
MKKLLLTGVAVILLAGCAQSRPLSSYNDIDLCTLKGRSIGYGDIKIMPRILAEFTRRGTLSISEADCETYIQTAKQNAQIDIQNNRDVLNQLARSEEKKSR